MTNDIVERFLAAKSPTWAVPTYINRRYHLMHFAAACPKLPSRPEPIERFLASIPGRLYRYNHWVSLRLLYRWASRREGVSNPCDLVEAPRKVQPEPYWLDEDELMRLLCHPAHGRRDRTLLWLLADTGMRIGEAFSIRMENVRPNTQGDRGDGWVYVIGKGNKPRWVPVSPIVMRMITTLAREPNGPLWYGKRGPMTLSGLKNAVRHSFARAGFRGRKMSAHRLRHTFATLWDGTDSDGMDIGGWSTWEVWRQYKHLRSKRIAEAHRNHGPIRQLTDQLGLASA